MKKTGMLFIIALFAFCGCDRNPAGALLYPSDNYESATSWAKTWILYDDDIKTRVLPFEKAVQAFTNFWEAKNPSWLNVKNFTGEAHTGIRSILMKWDGSASDELTSQSPSLNQVGYVGFGLVTTNDDTPRDISRGNYTKVKFWVKGTLFQGVVLRVEVDGTGPLTTGSLDGSTGVYEGPVTDTWRQYSVTLIQPTTSVKSFVKFMLKNTLAPIQSNGGTIYIDDIELVQ